MRYPCTTIRTPFYDTMSWGIPPRRTMNMPATRNYYTLLVRDSSSEPWQIHFGDYVRSVVHDEARDLKLEGYYKMKNMLLISTGDKQANIQARVNQLNGVLE